MYGRQGNALYIEDIIVPCRWNEDDTGRYSNAACYCVQRATMLAHARTNTNMPDVSCSKTLPGESIVWFLASPGKLCASHYRHCDDIRFTRKIMQFALDNRRKSRSDLAKRVTIRVDPFLKITLCGDSQILKGVH